MTKLSAVTLLLKTILELSCVSVRVMVPEPLSLTSTVFEKVVPLLWVIVKPASACELPTVPVTKIVEPVPEFKVKVPW